MKELARERCHSIVLVLTLLDETFTICRLPADVIVPAWAMPAGASFCAVARTRDELSIVCPTAAVPEGSWPRSVGWRCLRVQGPLDLSLSGVMVGLLAPLAEAKVAVFPVATFDTDWILVREPDLGRAIDALHRAGFEIRR